MKRRIQAAVFGILTVLLLFGVVNVQASDLILRDIEVYEGDFKIYLNGSEFIAHDAQNNIIKPFAYNGNMFIPAEELARALNMGVNWDGNTNTLYLGHQRALLTALRFYVGNVGTYPWGSSSVGAVENIYLCGVRHSDALVFRSDSETPTNPFTLHNLQGMYRTLNGIVGRLDDSGAASITLHFIGDGKTLQTVEMSAGDMPKYFSVPVEGVAQLMIQMDFPGVEMAIDYAIVASLE